MNFEAFPEIKQWKKQALSITQKIHGSNASITVFQKEDGELDLVCGSRTRFIYPGQDNYGFATFVNDHKDEFIQKLGIGRHDGEWAGPGINSGEGLKERVFVLFDHWKWPEDRPRPPQTVVVPVMHYGKAELSKVDECMDDLKANGSKLIPGYMHPEGVVVMFGGQRYKRVFDAEETAWTKKPGAKGPRPAAVDYTHLCQPIRLEKLLSRDELYLQAYPNTLPALVKDYVGDLIKEGQISGTEDEVKAITKRSTAQIFKFIRTMMEERDAQP